MSNLQYFLDKLWPGLRDAWRELWKGELYAHSPTHVPFIHPSRSSAQFLA